MTEAAGKPILLIFVHEANRPSVAMTRLLMDYASTRSKDGLAAGVVWLTDDPTATEQFLKRARHAMPEAAPMGISIDGREGPGAYGLNRNVTLTVLVAEDNVVTANFALVQPSLPADAPRILDAIVARVGGEAPSLDDLGVQTAMPARDGSAARAEMAPALRGLLRPVIRRDATPKEVETAAEAVQDYVNDRPAARAQVGRAARTIIASGKLADYGTPRAREFLQKWAKSYAESPEPGPSNPSEDDRRKEGGSP